MSYQTRRILFIILAVSVLLRIGAALALGSTVETLPGIDDQLSYHMLAQRLLGGHGFTVAADWWPLTRAGEPTAHWSYLYTLYLAAVYALVGLQPLVARLLQVVVVGALMPLLAYRIARRVAGDSIAGDRIAGGRVSGEVVGLVAAGWVAVYGYFIYYSAALMTESFYITGLLWSLDLALSFADRPRSPWRWPLFGLAMGLTILLRQLFIVAAPILLAWAWLVSLPRIRGLAVRDAFRSLGRPLLAVAVIAVLVAPWTLRNYEAFHTFVLLNTNSGFVFFWANHPIYGTRFVGILPPPMTYLDLIPAELRPLNEAALDSALMREGMKFVLQDPLRYVLLSLSRFGTYFMFWPSADSGAVSNVVRVLSFGVALPAILYGLVVSIRRWRSWLLLYLFILAYCGIHLASWALIRYRLPVDAVLLVFAAYGVVDIASRLRSRAGLLPPSSPDAAAGAPR